LPLAGPQLRPLGVLPGLGGSFGELARYGQLDRLLNYYIPAWLEQFPAVRFFSFEPERLGDFTNDRELLRRVELIAPRSVGSTRLHAIWLGVGRGRARLLSCALVRVLQAPGGVAPALAGAPFVCTYGYSYQNLTTAPFEGPLKGTALAAKRATMQAVLTLILRRAEATIVTSIIGEAEARALGARRIACIPNGVDLDLFTPLRSEKDYDVVFVGRLAPEKDLPTLLEAASLLGGLRIAIVGDGPLREDLAARAAAIDVELVLLGALPHSRLPEVLARSRCFVLPSPYEGQPKALLEAMACGLPCVAANIPAVKELAGEDAIALFKPGRPDSLAASIRCVLDDLSFATKLGRNARNVIWERFNLRMLLQREVQLLGELAGSRDVCRPRTETFEDNDGGQGDQQAD
jgi:glycosyltransferase involved in cell wall biosynthesis